jgi:hypothetical protein
VGEKTKMMTEQELPKEFKDVVEQLKNSIKDTRDCVERVRAVGRKYGLPKELVDRVIHDVLKKQGFSSRNIRHIIHGRPSRAKTAKQQGHKSLQKEKTFPSAIEMGEEDGIINQQSIDQFAELPMENIKKDVYVMDITSLRRLLLEAVEEIKEYEKIIDMNTERFQFFARQQAQDRRRIEELEHGT